jgi:hypothetical protein
MPRGDKTGPKGAGPKTGRALGYCVGNNQAGFENNAIGYGRGFGRGNRHGNGLGRGMGFGFRHGNNYQTEDLTDVSEKTLLENEINILKDKLAALEKRLNNLKE